MLIVRRMMLRSLVLISPVVLLAQQPGYYPPQNQAPNYEQQGYDALDQADPPSRVARISQISGDVSVQPASVNDFSAAEVNLPMTTGDRIYSGPGGLAEIQTGQLAVRTGQNTDLTVTAMTDTLAQFGLAQGSAHLRSYAVSANGTVEIDTPNVAVSVLQAGDIRVDSDPNSDATIVTVLSGQIEVDGNGLQQTLQGGERARFVGSNPVSAQWLGRPGVDGLDRFSLERDQLYESAYASEGGYVNPGTIGAEDLSADGDWSTDGDYGAVWYPRGVAYDWQPYRNGHWTWVAPWGWTWVEAEPWGFAPFHYGRWNRFGNRWGWIPGPVVVRPIYSPALVVFVGGGNIGVSAWFPLGPRETYVPWYHASPLYVNRVNVSNIYSRDTVQVRNIYNQRTTNVYINNTTVNNRVYVNRQVATVAMPQESFASGRRADQNLARVNPQALASAQVLPHPLVTPQRGMVQQAPARVMPARLARPELESRTDAAVQPGSFRRPQPAGLNEQPAPVARQPQPSFGQGNRPTGAQVQGGVSVPPVQSGPAVQQQRAVQNPPQTNVPADDGRYRPGNNKTTVAPTQTPAIQSAPAQGGMNIQVRPVGPAYPPAQIQQPIQTREQPQQQPRQFEQPAQQPAQEQQPTRPLFNKAVPPEPRPSFEQQREAIQATDPGRPLGPQQLNNLRQNQPAGQPQQREQPHPAPQVQRSAPPAPAVAPKTEPKR
jgi:hypothetical protein